MRKRCRSQGCREYVGVGVSYCPAHKPYGAGWAVLRAEILRRDDYRCQIGSGICTDSASTVDHIDGDTRNDHPSNLRAACRPCNSAKGGIA